MGLIKAALGSVGGVLADQWREYFYCDSLSTNVLVAKGAKRTTDRTTNTKNSDDIITNGSVIVVNEGQCMMIVDQGKVVDFCAEPGEYIFDLNGEPSLFYSAFDSDKAMALLKETFDRFSFGGQAGKDQRVYFFNTKEIADNLQKQGAFIEGVRPGNQTAEYLGKTINRLNLFGALALGLIAMLPFLTDYVSIVISGMPIGLSLSGTGLLIVVTVALENLRQLNSRALMATYDEYK